MAELQLMKELAEKRRKEGKMTPKQKEMMDKELAKEKVRMNRVCLFLSYSIPLQAIRDELEVLYSSCESALSKLNGMVRADGGGALQRPGLLVKRTIPLLRVS